MKTIYFTILMLPVIYALNLSAAETSHIARGDAHAGGHEDARADDGRRADTERHDNNFNRNNEDFRNRDLENQRLEEDRLRNERNNAFNAGEDLGEDDNSGAAILDDEDAWQSDDLEQQQQDVNNWQYNPNQYQAQPD